MVILIACSLGAQRYPQVNETRRFPLPGRALHKKSILDSFFGSLAIYNYQ
jgi:hypothetical protein